MSILPIYAAFHSIQPLVSGAGRVSDLLQCAREQLDTGRTSETRAGNTGFTNEDSWAIHRHFAGLTKLLQIAHIHELFYYDSNKM